MKHVKHLDLFSGIGGFALATEMVWEEVEHTFCDNEPFSQAIIKKHWPNATMYGDIKTLKGSDIGPVDLLTGGFPCQPFSVAGQRKGTEDDRHLWPEMLRVIRETTPHWIIGENVGGLLTWNGGMVLDQVFADLEAEGYEVWAFVIPAAAVGAPHRRDRVWIVGHASCTNSSRQRRQQIAGSSHGHESSHEGRSSIQTDQPASSGENAPDTACGRRREGVAERGRSCERARAPGEWSGPANSDSAWREEWPAAATRLCIVDDGLPGGLARPRGWRKAALKGAGNAIVPQVAAMIMRGIRYANNNHANDNRRAK